MKKHLKKWFPFYIGIICGFAFSPNVIAGIVIGILFSFIVGLMFGAYDNKDIA
jgi:hypothetical protein